jgi:hypothetical protein
MNAAMPKANNNNSSRVGSSIIASRTNVGIKIEDLHNIKWRTPYDKLTHAKIACRSRYKDGEGRVPNFQFFRSEHRSIDHHGLQFSNPPYHSTHLRPSAPQTATMPALLEDPSTRNPPPQAHVQAAPTLSARRTTLPKFADAPMTLYPITGGPQTVPKDLVKFLHEQFSAEIIGGNTYPMEQPMLLDQFADYWFGTFAVLAILDDEGEGLREGRDWENVCLGTFYTKPNYPGMSVSCLGINKNDRQCTKFLH